MKHTKEQYREFATKRWGNDKQILDAIIKRIDGGDGNMITLLNVKMQ